MPPDPYRRRLEMILENAHHGIVVVSSRGIIELANPALGRLTGHDYRALAGQRLDWIIPEPHREKHDAYMDEYGRGAHSEILTRGRIISIQHVDGRKIPVFIRVHETRLDGEHFFTAILEDISEQTILRDQLSDGQKLLQSVVESHPCGLFITDSSASRNVYVNAELCQIYGATEGELLLPGAWQHFIYPPDRSLVFATMQEALRTLRAARLYTECRDDPAACDGCTWARGPFCVTGSFTDLWEVFSTLPATKKRKLRSKPSARACMKSRACCLRI